MRRALCQLRPVFVSPLSGSCSVCRVRRTPRHCSAGLPHLRPSSRRAWGSPGVLPGCFRCVTVGSTWSAVSVTGTSDCVAPSSPCLPPLTRRRVVSLPFYSVRSARIFASGLFRGTVTGSPLALGFPSPLPGWDGTCPLSLAHPLAAGPCPAHNVANLGRRSRTEHLLVRSSFGFHQFHLGTVGVYKDALEFLLPWDSEHE